MAKKVVSIMKKKPVIMKRDNKKKVFLGKIMQYLKSDNYMFASLISSNGSDTFAPEASGVLENERSVDETSVEDYVTSDCYMYSPLIMSQPWLKASKVTRQHTESMKKWSEDRLGEKEKISCEDNSSNGSPRAKKTVVARRVSKKETVKHILQSPSEPGKVTAKTRGGRRSKVA